MNAELSPPEDRRNIPSLVMPRKQRMAVTAGVMTGMFLAALEATVVGTAMPTVIAALGGLQHYSWVFSAYLLTSTVTVPVWGKLSDLYGRRRLFQIGVGVFLLGSILSGLSTSMFQLIVFRAIQGLGAGALVPLAMTIIGDIYTLQERTRMQALFSGVWGFASIVGPIIGGFLTDQLSWRWVFFINIPFGLLSSLIIGASLKEPKLRQRPIIDYAGAITLMSSVTLLMLALVESGTMQALLTLRNLLLLLGSALLAILFVRIERRTKEPILPFSLFRNRVVSIAVTAGFLIGIAMFGSISFIPLYAQGTRGDTATEAGSLLTPLMLSWVTLSVIGGRFLLKAGYRPTVIAGSLLLTIAFALLSTFDGHTPRSLLYLDLVLIGAGLGLTMLTLLIAVQQAVPREILGTATSLNQFSRSIGGAVGVAIMGAFLSAGMGAYLRDAAKQPNAIITPADAERLAANPNSLIDPSARTKIEPAKLQVLQNALTVGLKHVFRLGMIASCFALVIVFWLPTRITSRLGETAMQPHPKACESKTGERLVVAELTTIDPEHEPAAVEDD
ncbi:MAG TPA: MDR family MFS transporter [Acidobacteriota bacterium]|nr:MDR family MFS transporter [Acidobacteriota bacterium]